MLACKWQVKKWPKIFADQKLPYNVSRVRYEQYLKHPWTSRS